jgi:hypothetical protein
LWAKNALRVPGHVVTLDDIATTASVLATSKVSFVTLCASLSYLTYQQQIVLEKMSKSATLNCLVEALSCAEPLAMHDALELNNRELTHSRKGSVDTDHWAFCIGDDFIPVQTDTMIHSAFKSGCFSVDSIFEPSVCVNRTLSARRSQKIQDIEAIQQIPMLQEWCALLDLGFVPLCMASKLEELQRQVACANELIAFKVSQSIQRFTRWRLHSLTSFEQHLHERSL